MYYKGFNYKMYWGLFVKWLFVLYVVVVVNGMEVNKEGEGREGRMIVKGDANDNGLPRVYVQVEEDESDGNSGDVEGSYGYDKGEERKYKSKSLRGVKGDNGKENENENGLDEDRDEMVYKYNKGYGGNKRMAKSIKKSRFSTNKYL